MNNWTRDLKRVYGDVTSPTFVATAGNFMHISIPGAPNEGVVLKRLRIVGTGVTTTGSNYLDIKIISDPGKYQEAEASATGSGEDYVVFAWNDETSPEGPNRLWLSDVTFSDDVIYADGLDSTNLYLRLEAPNGLTDHGTFRAQFWGDGLMRTNEYPPNDTAKKDLAIRRWSTFNIWKDLRGVRGDAEHNLLNPNPEHTLFLANTDYLYFGLTDPFDGLWFKVGTPNPIAGVTATWQYYNGSTWATLTVRDNCAATDAIGNTNIFAYSGIIEWDEPTDWAKTDLSSVSAPLDGPVTPLAAYGTFPTGDDGGSRVNRYWVRLSLSNFAGQPTFNWIRSRPLV